MRALLYVYKYIDIVCFACAVSACDVLVLVLSVRSAFLLCRAGCAVRCALLLYGVLVL